ncbi:MAG: hypothetical protein ACNYWU_05815 [Desulfobacterales bacterium]
MRIFMKQFATLAILATLFITGCVGIKFNNSTNVFKAPPGSLKERTLWHDPSVIQYKLQSLSGYIVSKKANSAKFKRIKQILPDNFKIEPEPIADGEFYHSLINAKFATEGSGNVPILFAAASLSSEQMMEITIVDKVLIHVDDKIIPWDSLKEFVENNPLQEGEERFWVQAVMVTQVFTKTAVSVDSDAQVSGSAYQVAGQTYNASETQDRTPYITMLTLDVDEAIQGGAGIVFSAKNALQRGRIARNISIPLE